MTAAVGAGSAGDGAAVVARRSSWRAVAPAASPHALARASALGAGVLGLIATVVFVSSPVVGVVATATTALALAWGAALLGDWRRWRGLPHAVSALLALLAAAGLCATRCGGYAAYERFAGMPTAIAGLVLHGAIALSALAPWRSRRATALLDGAIAVAIGASLFYAAVLVAVGAWCGACGAIHALMVAQAVFLLRSPAAARASVVAIVLASAGAINAVYHHRVAEVRDDPAALLAYLRGLWSERRPPQLVEQYSDADHVAATPTDDPAPRERHPLAAVTDAAPAPSAPAAAATARAPLPSSRATPPSPRTHRDATGAAARARTATGDTARVPDPAGASGAVASDAAVADRAVADANRWGRREAPVTMLVAIDTGCPACAGHFAQLLELRDLVEGGRLQVRLLLTYRNDAAQATASLAYAAGFLGDQPLVEALASFYREQKRILVPADALAALPESLPRAVAVATLRRHQQDVSALLGDAAKLKERLGATSEPTTWLMPTGEAEPARTFQGATLASILRLASLSLMPADARDLPSFTAATAR